MEFAVLEDLEIPVLRKSVRNLRIKVSPDFGVRITAPVRMPLMDIQDFVEAKSGWIKKHVERIEALPKRPVYGFLDGEKHPFRGEWYTLHIRPGSRITGISCTPEGIMEMHLSKPHDTTQREKVLQTWYRKEMKSILPHIIEKWENVIGVKSEEWGIKQMKTKWGTCNIQAKRIWLNLELIKKHPMCLEYVVVHELVHLLERYHNARFYGFMDQFMPEWRTYEGWLYKEPVEN